MAEKTRIPDFRPPRRRPAAPAGRRGYAPPRVERATRLDSAVRFGGSNIVDSGNGLGAQPGPFRPSG